MTPKNYNILPTYGFILLNDYHFLSLSTWIAALRSKSMNPWETLLPYLKAHPKLWNSRWTKTWMMEVNGQPAFCVSFYTYNDRNPSPEDNRLYLLAAPSIQRSSVKLMRAWQAAAVHIFQQEKPDFLSVEVPVAETAEREAIQRIGFREIGGDPEISALYICNRGEITPVF
jgi:hypothetical protein